MAKRKSVEGPAKKSPAKKANGTKNPAGIKLGKAKGSFKKGKRTAKRGGTS